MKKPAKYGLAILALILFMRPQPHAQQYIWPLKINPQLSSRFGDCRSGHWHSGLDFRTQGQTGLKVYAVGNGFVSRVRTSFWGYGKSLYLKLADGNSIVYGHLMGFTPEIDRFISNQQIRQKKYYQDISFAPDQFPVRKGDIIAFSGQSGVGYPHLHLEIRDNDNIPLNPLKSYYHISDNIPPTIQRLAVKRYINYGFNNHHETEFLAIAYRKGNYLVNDTIAIYGQTVLAMNAYDPGSDFSYGIYNAVLSVDGNEIFAFAHDSLNYLTGSQIGYVHDNQLQLLVSGENKSGGDDKNVFYRLYCQSFDRQTFYGKYHHPAGILDADSLDNAAHSIEIRLYDVNGNSSRVVAYIKKAVLPKPRFQKLIKYGNEFRLMIDSTLKDITLEMQALTIPVSGYRNLKFHMDSTRSKLTFAVSDAGRGIRVRIRNVSGDFSPWACVNTDLKQTTIIPYADFFELINVRDRDIQRFKSFPEYNIVDRLAVDDSLWQGLLDIRRFNGFVELCYPGDSVPVRTYFCDRGELLTSPDSLVSVTLDDKNLYGRTIIGISSIQFQSKKPYSFEIIPNEMLLSDQAQMTVDLGKLNLDNSKTSLYAQSSGDWYFKSELVNGKATCSITGGGRFAILKDYNPPAISGLKPSNGSSIRNLKPLVTCRVIDDLSGLSKETQFEMYIDDGWAPAEYNITTKIYSYQITRPLKPGIHMIKIKVSDNQGNQATASTKFTVLGKY
jgi:hypothetical protein